MFNSQAKLGEFKTRKEMKKCGDLPFIHRVLTIIVFMYKSLVSAIIDR